VSPQSALATPIKETRPSCPRREVPHFVLASGIKSLDTTEEGIITVEPSEEGYRDCRGARREIIDCRFRDVGTAG
jgi:hypothetical protein